MTYKPPASIISTMKERSLSSSSTSKTNMQSTLSMLSNSSINEQPLVDEDHISEIDSPNLMATSVESNGLLSSNSTISLLSLNKPSMSRTASFSNPLMLQRVQLRRYSNNNTNGSNGINIPQPSSGFVTIDPVPETPNLDPTSIQNSPSNFWLNKPMIKRQSSVTAQNVNSPFLYPVRDHDGNVTPLILSPNKNELKDDVRK